MVLVVVGFKDGKGGWWHGVETGAVAAAVLCLPTAGVVVADVLAIACDMLDHRMSRQEKRGGGGGGV